jgi:hypothetical protein
MPRKRTRGQRVAVRTASRMLGRSQRRTFRATRKGRASSRERLAIRSVRRLGMAQPQIRKLKKAARTRSRRSRR